MTEDKKEQLNKLLQEKVRLEGNIRTATKERLSRVILAKGSMISPATMAPWLDIGWRQLYRVLNNNAWLPRLADCENFNGLMDVIEQLRAVWPGFIKVYDKIKDGLPLSLKQALFNPALLKVLEDDSIPPAEKAEELTVKTLRELNAQMREEPKAKTEEKPVISNEKLAEALSKAPDWKTGPAPVVHGLDGPGSLDPIYRKEEKDEPKKGDL